MVLLRFSTTLKGFAANAKKIFGPTAGILKLLPAKAERVDAAAGAKRRGRLTSPLEVLPELVPKSVPEFELAARLTERGLESADVVVRDYAEKRLESFECV